MSTAGADRGAGGADQGAAGADIGHRTSTSRQPTAPGGRPARVAWFHCFAGIAGDMALGSLIDAGADVDGIREILGRLPVGGWELAATQVLRGGVSATRALVTVTDDQTSRTFREIAAIVTGAGLPERVARRSLAVFSALADVEGRLHGQLAADVHFHEVGGHDSLVDVVGTMAALELLAVDEIEASPVAQGSGVIRASHGVLPNPPPAVIGLLRGAPVVGTGIDAELTTPTGAAILAALAERFGPVPAMEISSSGFGAGSRELDELPNCTQVVVGTRLPASVPTGLPATSAPAGVATPSPMSPGRGSGPTGVGAATETAWVATGATVGISPGQPVSHLETNVDDATGEQLATAVADLLEAGAHDAWLAPIIMKKGRPATTVHVLCDPIDAGRLRSLLADRTGSFGVRGSVLERWPQPREVGSVEVDGQVIRVKASRTRVKAEHDDVVGAAAVLGRPVRDVARDAESAYRGSSRD